MAAVRSNAAAPNLYRACHCGAPIRGPRSASPAPTNRDVPEQAFGGARGPRVPSNSAKQVAPLPDIAKERSPAHARAPPIRLRSRAQGRPGCLQIVLGTVEISDQVPDRVDRRRGRRDRAKPVRTLSPAKTGAVGTAMPGLTRTGKGRYRRNSATRSPRPVIQTDAKERRPEHPNRVRRRGRKVRLRSAASKARSKRARRPRRPPIRRRSRRPREDSSQAKSPRPSLLQRPRRTQRRDFRRPQACPRRGQKR